MTDNPFLPLTFIAGPAIMTNACAILQNSATMRYGLAVPQWREFRASLAEGSALLADLYAQPERAMVLAERRLRLLLRALDLLYAAVGLFGATSLLGLAGAVLASQAQPLVPVWLVVATGGLGLSLLLAAMGLFTEESRCVRALLRLQIHHPRWSAAPS
ncbi:DUF2721 domain-containing protein [Phenylobacterium terrae]|uniref:DUF2721 domain-containing protein n=1 Tax=Phenylobacterium terrae TaxID=2665495 RepID=A0ABW4N5V3_9CAUL